MINVMQTAWNKLFFIGISFLFLWSIFLRFYNFGQTPNGLYWDETAILLDAKSVAETGKDMHSRPWYQIIYPSYGDYKLPVYIWFSAVAVKVLGPNEVAVRLPSALAGLGTIIVSAFLIKELLSDESRKTRHLLMLITALVVALSPWSILFSRTGFESHLAQFLLALSLLIALMSRKKSWFILLSPVIGVFATYTYFSVRYVWLAGFILLSLLFLIQIEKVTSDYKKVVKFFVLNCALPLIIFSLGLLPMLRSPLYESSNTFRLSTDSVLQNTPEIIQSNVYREMAGNQKADRIIFNKWWLTGKKLFANYSDNVSLNFLFMNGDPNLRHGTGQFGLFYSILLPFFLTGWYVLARRYKKVGLLLFTWWMAALLPASVPNTTPHALRSLNALVPLAIVISVGLCYSMLYLNEQVKNFYLKTSIIGVFFLMTCFTVIQFTHFYFVEYPTLSYPAWQGGYKQLAETIFKVRDKQEPVYVVNFDDRFYLWILLYGPYSPDQIQSFAHSNFQVRDFDNIFTEHFPSPADKVLVVGTAENVSSYATKNNYMIIKANSFSTVEDTVYEAANLELNVP